MQADQLDMTDVNTAGWRHGPPTSALARLDAPAAAVVILMSPLLGSVATGLIVAIAIVGWLRLFTLQRIVLPRPVWWTSVAFVGFFAAEALSGAANWNGLATLIELGENLVLLGLLPVYLLLSRDRAALLDFLLKAAPLFALAVLAVALVQSLVFGIRPEGGAGNPAVFAVTVAVLFAFTLANLARAPRGGELALAAAGIAAAGAALLLSGTRSLWPCLVVFPVLMWLATRRLRADAKRPLMLALAAMLVMSLAFGGMIRDRLEQARADLAASQAGQMQTALGKRLVVWQVAVEAIAERPLLGHGPDAPRRLMAERTGAIAGQPVIFNHFHDFVLNEMVRAGLVGTLALGAMLAVPLGFALFSRRDATAAVGLGLLACFQAAFVQSGLVGIMLDHDIMDAQFMAMTALCLFLLFGADAARPGPGVP